MAPLLQPGNQVRVVWRARLDEHIGTFTAEPLRSRAAILSDRLALHGLNAVCGLLAFALPEREPHPLLYPETIALLDGMAGGSVWLEAYLRWELLLLEELGYGLDLRSCAVTGETADLDYVSPRTGRAVSAAGAGIWAGRLLPLPAVMLGKGTASPSEIALGLRTTGHFLETRLAREVGERPLPDARRRLAEAVAALARRG
jgi:DNA repair protein RecO (recombination protein O)